MTNVFKNSLFFLLLILGGSIYGQKFMQLEVFKEVKAIKFAEGDFITFKTKEFPKEWQTKQIERIIVDNNIIIFEDGMVSVKDMTHFRIENTPAKAMGKLLSGFGAGWLLFGSIAHVTSETNKFTLSTFIIGATAISIGWLFNKVVSKRTYKIGKTANVRLLDTSFPLPEQVVPSR